MITIDDITKAKTNDLRRRARRIKAELKKALGFILLGEREEYIKKFIELAEIENELDRRFKVKRIKESEDAKNNNRINGI